MKLLFASSDCARLEQVRKRLSARGIRSEIRMDAEGDPSSELPVYPGLWVQNNTKFWDAVKLFCAPHHPS